MIISRTPFRISFFGGGTDYFAWYKENGGAVLATSIDKYCYISCRYLPPFFEHRYRIVYSKVENVREISEIAHPAVRAALEHMGIAEGLEIHHDGDLPARTGMGSSSAFVIGILHTLYALKGVMPTMRQLSMEAIHIERDILRENVGSQDQILVAMGGFNKITFHKDDDYGVTPITISKERLEVLQDHLMLCFTGFSRFASEVARSQIENIPNKKTELSTMQQMVDEAISILNSSGPITEFGQLLHEAWKLKRGLSDRVSTAQIDEIYQTARNAGAIGGKVLGAGGGGFILFFARPQDQLQIRQRLHKLLHVPFRFEAQGSKIVVYEPGMGTKY